MSTHQCTNLDYTHAPTNDYCPECGEKIELVFHSLNEYSRSQVPIKGRILAIKRLSADIRAALEMPKGDDIWTD